MMRLALFSALEMYRDSREGKEHLITLSAAQINRCSFRRSLAAVAGEPGDDGVGECGLSGGRVELSQHGTWQPEFPQLAKEKEPLLGLIQEGHGVLLPLQIPGDGDTQKAEGVHRDILRHNRKGRGCIPLEIPHHLHCLKRIALQVVTAAPTPR